MADSQRRYRKVQQQQERRGSAAGKEVLKKHKHSVK
eukprot:gene12881-3575_t